MATIFDQLQDLRETLVDIAAYNGGINRERSEESYLADVQKLAVKLRLSPVDARKWDLWIATLTDDQKMILADGEESEREDLVDEAPSGLEDFLQKVFEEAV